MQYLYKVNDGDLLMEDDGDLAVARSQTQQLPPNFRVVYRCKACVDDPHRCLPRKGHTLERQTWVTPCGADVGDLGEADDGGLATARS